MKWYDARCLQERKSVSCKGKGSSIGKDFKSGIEERKKGAGQKDLKTKKKKKKRPRGRGISV